MNTALSSTTEGSRSCKSCTARGVVLIYQILLSNSGNDPLPSSCTYCDKRGYQVSFPSGGSATELTLTSYRLKNLPFLRRPLNFGSKLSREFLNSHTHHHQESPAHRARRSRSFVMKKFKTNFLTGDIFEENLAAFQESRRSIYGGWMIVGISGGVLGAVAFGPQLNSPWWVFAAYLAAVAATKKAFVKLARRVFPGFAW